VRKNRVNSFKTLIEDYGAQQLREARSIVDLLPRSFALNLWRDAASTPPTSSTDGAASS